MPRGSKQPSARECVANSSAAALIARLKLEIEKLRRELQGTRSERKEGLLGLLEMKLDNLEAVATEDELAADAVARSTDVASFQRNRPVRKPFPTISRVSALLSPRQRAPLAGR
ncbi:transposase [Ancylobacter oerskovii]|nr:transposase [Ancylobacter oerskovii]